MPSGQSSLVRAAKDCTMLYDGILLATSTQQEPPAKSRWNHVSNVLRDEAQEAQDWALFGSGTV
jgi:hypothetical protein